MCRVNITATLDDELIHVEESHDPNSLIFAVEGENPEAVTRLVLRYLHEHPERPVRSLQLRLPTPLPRWRLKAVVHGFIELVRKSVQERDRRALQRARNISWGTDPEGACTSINEAWEYITGHAAEEDLGSGWMARVHPKDQPGFAAVWQQAFAARQPFSNEFRLRCANGDYIWMRNEGKPNFTEGGIFLGYTGEVFRIRKPRIKPRIRSANEPQDQKGNAGEVAGTPGAERSAAA